MAGPLPQVNALIFCDQAFQQAVTGKWCIIGTYAAIWVREFPATHSPLSVFVSLSDFGGNGTVQLSIRDSDGEHVVSVRIQVPALPVSVFEFPFTFPPVLFKAAGTYSVELFSGGELLAVRSLRVDKIDPTKMPFAFFGPGGPGGMPPGMPGGPGAPGGAGGPGAGPAGPWFIPPQAGGGDIGPVA